MSKFKVGDKVKHAILEVFGNGDEVRTIESIGMVDIPVWFEETDTWLFESELELVETSPNKHHKHHDSIIAWSEGADIEYYSRLDNCWQITLNPQWSVNSEYRIKPEKSDRNVVIESIQNHIDELQTRLDILKGE